MKKIDDIVNNGCENFYCVNSVKVLKESAELNDFIEKNKETLNNCIPLLDDEIIDIANERVKNGMDVPSAVMRSVIMWEKLGFLEGLNEALKLNCSLMFTTAANFLMKYLEKYQVIIFPIIRSLAEKHNVKSVNMSELMKIIIDVYSEFEHKTSLKNFNELDFNGEVCLEVVDRYISNYLSISKCEK